MRRTIARIATVAAWMTLVNLLRYPDLPVGLHVRVEAQGRHSVVCLLPG
jgi:hypothetical protein